MGKTILRGLIAVAPIGITIALIVWLYEKMELFFGMPVKYLLGPKYYFPGLGIIVAFIVLFLIGLILNTWMMQRLYNWFEKILKRIPLLKTIYTSITDLMSFFHAGEKQGKGHVVMVEICGVKMLGLVTRETFDDLPKGVGEKDEVAVFFPFSYQIGGMTAIIKKSHIKPVDLSLERGLRFAVTAGNPSADKPTYPPKKG